MMLIGLAGPARSGKDTVAAHVAPIFGLERYAFAQPIKRAIQVMFGLDERHTEGNLKEVQLPVIGCTPRRLMQTLGTEWGRDTIDSQLWTKLAGCRWEQCKRQGKGLLITDVRYDNEAQFIRDNGGVIVHVLRPTRPDIEAHASERPMEIQPQDWTIGNSSDVSALLDLAERAFRKILTTQHQLKTAE